VAGAGSFPLPLADKHNAATGAAFVAWFKDGKLNLPPFSLE
jgi:hypothetical protein